MTRAGRRAFLASAATLAMAGRAGAQDAIAMRYLTPFGFLMGFTETLYGDTGGFFRRNGLNVTIEGGNGSAMAVQQVTAGNVLVSRTGGTDLLKAYARDTSLVAIGDIFPQDIFWVVSLRDQPINRPEDMAGKTIGVVSVGGATENLLDMMLVKAGVPRDSVRRQSVGAAPTVFELVRAGRIQGFITTNDGVFQLNAARAPIHAWSTDDVAPAPGQVYITSRRALETQGEALARFLRSVRDSLEAITSSNDLAGIIASMTARYDISESRRPDRGLAVLQHAVANYRRVLQNRLRVNADKFAAAQELMVQAQIITPLPDRAYYDMGPWNRAFG
jgi:NitT/TauT family transport system substrate-binding protein